MYKKVDLVCLYIDHYLSAFPERIGQAFCERLEIDTLYRMNNSYQETV